MSSHGEAFSGFALRGFGDRQKYGDLIAVEVGVHHPTNERMEADHMLRTLHRTKRHKRRRRKRGCAIEDPLPERSLHGR